MCHCITLGKVTDASLYYTRNSYRRDNVLHVEQKKMRQCITLGTVIDALVQCARSSNRRVIVLHEEQ